jgi:SAM-dependent methyltransferase
MNPIDKPTVYDDFAHYYDLFYYTRDEDHEFYLELWEELGKAIKVLELACGSGRLLVPMVEAGMNISGVDISAQMLELCHNRLADEVRARVRHGDMSKLEEVFGAEKFDLIILAFNTFQHLMTEAEQMACLQAVHRQLAEGGQFSIAVNNPVVEKKLIGNERAEFWGIFPNPAHKSQVRLLVSVTDYMDEQKSHHRYQFFEQLPDEDGLELTIGLLNFYFLYYDQLKALLEKAGFRVIAEYGDYDFSPFGAESPNIIFICTHLDSAP